jgi:hypothetical protein
VIQVVSTHPRRLSTSGRVQHLYSYEFLRDKCAKRGSQSKTMDRLLSCHKNCNGHHTLPTVWDNSTCNTLQFCRMGPNRIDFVVY